MRVNELVYHCGTSHLNVWRSGCILGVHCPHTQESGYTMTFPMQQLVKWNTYVWKCACLPTFSSNFSRKLKSVAGPGRIHSSSFQRKREALIHSVHHTPSIPSLNAFAAEAKCLRLKFCHLTQAQVSMGGGRAAICYMRLTPQRDWKFFEKSTLPPIGLAIYPESSQGRSTASMTSLRKHTTSFSLNQSCWLRTNPL